MCRGKGRGEPSSVQFDFDRSALGSSFKSTRPHDPKALDLLNDRPMLPALAVMENDQPAEVAGDFFVDAIHRLELRPDAADEPHVQAGQKVIDVAVNEVKAALDGSVERLPQGVVQGRLAAVYNCFAEMTRFLRTPARGPVWIPKECGLCAGVAARLTPFARSENLLTMRTND